MAFNLPGKSITSGTSSHSSALKMRAEQNASALKKKTDYEAMQKASTKNDARYGKMSAADYKTEVNRQVTSNKAGKGYDAMGVYDSKGNKKASAPTTTTPSSKVTTIGKGGKITTNINDDKGDTKVVTKNNLLNKGTTTTKSSVMADGTTKDSKFRRDADGDNRMRKTTTKGKTSSGDGTYVKKSKSKYDKDGVRKNAKTVTKTDLDGDGKVDRKAKLKTNDKKGTEKFVVKAGGRRTVTKTDKEGNKTTKSRRTLKGFFTGKGKKKKEQE
jgi:hypothetical protein|tara:strand:- start:43 stop:855 length:813 start_codon:yes stop_codon:yes gene_type:complete